MNQLPEFQSGDVLCFAGREFASRVIAFKTCSWGQLFRGEWFSHCGIVAPYAGNAKLFESTTLAEMPCDIQKRRVSGVQAHDPAERIAKYDGKVWLLRLVEHNKLRERKALRLSWFLQRAIETPYDYEQALLAGTNWIKRSSWTRPDKSSLFCDELVAMALMSIDVIGDAFNPSTVTPAWLAWFLVDRWIYEAPRRLK